MCSTLADLYVQYARVIRMCEGTVIKPYGCIRLAGASLNHTNTEPRFTSAPESYTFAVAIVENRPVFMGDVLYVRDSDDPRFEVAASGDDFYKPALLYDTKGRAALLQHFTWQASSKISEGFVEWKGGECPVGEHDEVEMIHRGGYVGATRTASLLNWFHTGGARDIIAYRVIKRQFALNGKVLPMPDASCDTFCLSHEFIEELGSLRWSLKEDAVKVQTALCELLGVNL